MVRQATRHMDDRGIFQWDTVYPDELILRGDIEKQQMHVIEDAGAVAGFVTINEEQSPEYREIAWSYQGRVLVVHRLTVSPKHQGKHLASGLMDFVEQEAAQRRYDTIRLDAFVNNPPAVSLYEKRGYRNAGTVHFRKGLFYCFERRVESSA